MKGKRKKGERKQKKQKKKKRAITPSPPPSLFRTVSPLLDCFFSFFFVFFFFFRSPSSSSFPSFNLLLPFLLFPPLSETSKGFSLLTFLTAPLLCPPSSSFFYPFYSSAMPAAAKSPLSSKNPAAVARKMYAGPGIVGGNGNGGHVEVVCPLLNADGSMCRKKCVGVCFSTSYV